MDKKRLDNLIVLMQKSGSEDAFAEFYALTKSGLYGFLLSIVKSREKAEDLMQDTYIKLRQSVQSYQAGTNAQAFLLQIGKNLAFNEMRRAKFETPSDFSAFDVPSKTTVEEEADKSVREAMLKILSVEEAQIVTLHVVAGFKHREIAEMTGKPLGTVLWSYNNSISKLKKYLKEE